MREPSRRNRCRLIILLLMFRALTEAQPSESSSPIYNEDGSVTFVLKRPESRHVRIYCDCALRNKKYNVNRENLHSARMHLDPSGRFTYTTPPLAPEVYTYRFQSHGQKLIDPGNADSIRISNGKRSVFVIPGSSLSDLCHTDSLAGRTETCEFWDSACGKTRRILLYLPPDYDNTEQTYPVLYLLHGVDGNEMAWHDRGRVVQMADNLIRQGKAKPMIIVMPDANPEKLIGQNESVGMMRNLLLYYSWFHHDFEQIFPQLDSSLSTRYRIAIFGSYARGEETPESDVDILVDLDYSKPVGLEFIQMQLDLQSLLQKSIDLVSSRGLSKYIKPYVDSEKLLLYEC